MNNSLDLNQYDNLLSSLYDGLTSEYGFNPFLRLLCKTFNCYTATLAIRDIRSGHLVGGWFQDMPESLAHWYMKNLAYKDPLLNYAFERSPVKFCSAQTESDITMNDPDIENWVQQSNIIDGACAVVHRDGKSATFLTLSRHTSQEPFTKQEMQILDCFINHIRRALDLNYIFVNQANVYGPIASAMNQLSTPLIVINSGFHISFLNSAAERWLARHDWVDYQNRLLTFSEPEHNAQLFSCISNMLNGGLSTELGQSMMVFPANANHGGSTMMISPLVNSSADVISMKSKRSNGVLLLIYEWKSELNINEQQLKVYFALSNTEAKVCALLCCGDSLESIAKKLSREMSTIRSHIKSLYRKTGTNRQAELVAHVLTSILRPQTTHMLQSS